MCYPCDLQGLFEGLWRCHVLRKTRWPPRGKAWHLFWSVLHSVWFGTRPQSTQRSNLHTQSKTNRWHTFPPSRAPQVQLKRGPHSTVDHSGLLLDTGDFGVVSHKADVHPGRLFLKDVSVISWVDLLSSYLHKDNRVEWCSQMLM